MRSKNVKIKLLIIGSLPPPIGGTTVLLKQLIVELSSRKDVGIHVINTADIRGAGLIGLFRLVWTMIRILIEVFRVDVVSMHTCDDPLPSVGLYTLFVSKLARKPVIFRKFAGTDYMESLGSYQRLLAHFTIKHADIFVAETKHLVNLARERGIPHAEWYSNSRPVPETQLSPDTGKFCRKFCYIGHVRPYKGIRELIEAAERCAPGIIVDVYGPFYEGMDERIFKNCRVVRYRGMIEPDAVVSVIGEYDAVLLPTKAKTEGYPGVIIESYIAGRPVIASREGAISEIVDKTSGILIPPGDTDALYQAMKCLSEDDALYQRLCEGASAKANAFDSGIWTDRFLAICRDLSVNYSSAPGMKECTNG